MSSNFEKMRTWGRSMMIGDQIVFRALESKDLNILSEWWNDTGEAILQQDRIAVRPTERVERMFSSWSANDTAGGFGYAINDREDHLIGHVAVWGIELPTRIGTLALMIAKDFQGYGYGRDAMHVALRIAFGEMGARKIEVQAWEYNDRALSLYKSLGFKEEGRRRAATFHASNFYDQVQLGMMCHEYMN